MRLNETISLNKRGCQFSDVSSKEHRVEILTDRRKVLCTVYYDKLRGRLSGKGAELP